LQTDGNVFPTVFTLYKDCISIELDDLELNTPYLVLH